MYYIKHKTSYNQERSGYITLISVLVVGAVGVGITLSLILLGLNSSRASFAIEQSYQAKALADACAEEGLEQIRSLTSFVGNGNLVLGQGSCTYNVTNQGGENRTVNTVGTIGSIVRKVRVVVSALNPRIIVSSWQEVSD